MSFEPALVQELKTITALENRIYPLTAPEATASSGVPYLIYASSEGLRDKTLGGHLESKEVRAELNIIAKKYSDMKAITKQAVALLVGFEGRAIGTDGPFIQEIIYQSPVEIYENQPDLYRCVVEFSAFIGEDDDQ
ncbi:tail completion protein gp17 [Cohnella massiliensis]|uniref:tail completion protein gp17 n=1 Tax=Cohnella massiliensis TaxID=1816691 RepID=UPI0009BC2F41|nr:DUF3168 domain-containing protein [Cohnella massiliensis]